MKVYAHYFKGMNFSWNLNILSGPKFHIVCGNISCRHGFDTRLPLRNLPEVVCPACRTINIVRVVFD